MFYIFKLGKFWVVMAFFVAGVFFSLHNQTTITLDARPLFNTMNIEAYKAFFACFSAGATVAILFFGVEYLRKHLEIRRLNKKIKLLESSTVSELTPVIADSQSGMLDSNLPSDSKLISD